MASSPAASGVNVYRYGTAFWREIFHNEDSDPLSPLLGTLSPRLETAANMVGSAKQ